MTITPISRMARLPEACLFGVGVTKGTGVTAGESDGSTVGEGETVDEGKTVGEDDMVGEGEGTDCRTVTRKLAV